MKKIRIGRILALSTAALGAAVFALTLISSVSSLPGSDDGASSTATAVMRRDTVIATTTTLLPARLVIPALGIDANVQRVGVTAVGNMAAPKGFSDVGWYKYGTIPGNLGSAVVAGHVDNGLGLAGVFKHLGDIKPGSDIFIVDTAGQRLHFVVDDIATYSYKDVPLESVFNAKDKARLNLVTCEGAWVGSEKTYDHRLVVYATLRGV